MIYQIKMMSGQQITLENEEALSALLREANEGKKLVLTKHGIVNVASIDSIVKHKEYMEEVSRQITYGKTKEEAEKDLMEPSPFKKLLETNKQLN